LHRLASTSTRRRDEGPAFRIPYSVVYDVSDGKIDQLRAYFPIMALVQQLKDAASVHA